MDARMSRALLRVVSTRQYRGCVTAYQKSRWSARKGRCVLPNADRTSATARISVAAEPGECIVVSTQDDKREILTYLPRTAGKMESPRSSRSEERRVGKECRFRWSR